MLLQRIAERSRNSLDGRKGCLVGDGNMPGEFLARVCGEFSSGCGWKLQEKNRDNRRRSEEWMEEKTVFWAVATPL